MRNLIRPLLLSTLCWFGSSVSASAADFIWVEGESAKEKNLHAHNWYESVKKGQLSGGAGAFNYGAEGLASYEFEVPADGDYTLWVRANPIAGPKLSYQLNGGEWQLINLEKNQDTTNIANDDKPDMRFVAWASAGKVMLKKGAAAIKFKMHSSNNNHGVLDCFIFTQKPFTPNGASKPGQKLNLAGPGTWAFEPDADEYDKKSEIDLRGLNEKKAGESGWVTQDSQGEFVLGNGKPARFWGINTSVYNNPDIEQLRAHAKFMAKRGVNMVRFHGSLWPRKAGSQITDVNEEELNKMQKCVSIMKEEGIYTTISPYWAIPANAQKSWNIPGKPGGSMPGLLFWDEAMQAGYRAWIKELLTRKNPYDPKGTPLGQDPALGLFQIQNEDSMLFWTIQGLKGEELKRLQKVYGAFLTKKYGSLNKAKEAWQGTGAQADDFANGAAGFMGMWEFNVGTGGGKGARLGDQLQFYTETMYNFNKMVDDYIHKELKCPVLINAGNWRTANQLTMLDAERYSYMANQVQGSNHYVGGEHQNPTEGHKAGYLVCKGDFFEDISVLTQPRKLGINKKQVAGATMIISESTWVPPVSYQSEGPFLIAAYSSLTGVDIYYWFATGSVGWDKTLNKWQFANASMLGGFPAAALLYRKGYVKRGEPALHEERKLADIYGLKSTLITEEEAFDPNRDAGSIPAESAVKTAASPLAFFVGPVEVKYEGDPANSKTVDFSKFINEGKKTVKSVTDELTLDYGAGFCTLNAPKAQGATGFLSKAGPIDLSTLKIDSKNEYATVLAVSLDDVELKDSTKVFLQITTKCRPYGWKETEIDFPSQGKKRKFHGKRVDDTGSAPWNVWNTDMTVNLKNPKIKKATLLDANGYPLEELKGEATGGVFTIKLPPNAMYVLLQ